MWRGRPRPRVGGTSTRQPARCRRYVWACAMSAACGKKPLRLVVDSYSTTAQNLEVWLRSFMPMADPAVIQKLPSSTMVTACVLQGSWVLPAGRSTGSADENYEVLIIGPFGAATPVLFGPSAIANAAAPEVGSN